MLKCLLLFALLFMQIPEKVLTIKLSRVLNLAGKTVENVAKETVIWRSLVRPL